MKCNFCNSEVVEDLFLDNLVYHTCKKCDGIFLDSSFFLSKSEQKKRYEKHNNSLSDNGYKNFLKAFIDPVLNFSDVSSIICNCKEMKILDYGSGPEPALIQLLNEYKVNDMLPKTTEIRGWDPFFAPNEFFYSQGAFLVTCLEVVEHFETPKVDMQKLSSCCAKNGYVAIGTELIPDNDVAKFSKWWYRQDKTHVSFFSKKALITLAENVGLSFIQELSNRSFLFKKK